MKITNNVLGIIYSNAYDESLPELTALRTMGSVPFAGRYRLIDFALSNMVNCGISKVGVITKSNYRSLMDHIGTGKPWDLDRKHGGIFLLPPFSTGIGVYSCRIDALNASMSFITRSNEEYVVLCDCNLVCNIDFGDLLSRHCESGADITVAYKHGKAPSLPDIMRFSFDSDGRIVAAPISSNDECDYSLNIFVLKKAMLERLIKEAVNLGYDDFERDIFSHNLKNLNIRGYAVDGYVRTLDSLATYFSASMELLDITNRAELFNMNRPVLTKIQDEMSAIYGLGSSVSNSLVSDGCVIDGEVVNSVLFRGVKVAKGASVRNSIIMQGTQIGENATLNCVVADKRVSIGSGKTISGAETYPIYIGKEISI